MNMNNIDSLAVHLPEPIQIQLLDEDAVVPTRAGEVESGLDLTPICVVKQLRPDTWLLGTGIAAKPPKGTYLDMVGRSSISKTPVHVANAVGIIDTTYRQDIMIAVTPKAGVDLETFDPQELINGKPLAQLILRPLLIADTQVVESLDETTRNGGFGSTTDAAKA